MKTRLAGIFSLCYLALLSGPVLAQTDSVAWRSDFQAAQAEARESGKLLLVHFWTESCGPCKVLEKRVYNQPAVAVAIDQQFVPVKINAEQAPEIARAYGVTRVPTDAVVAPDGRLVKQFVSPASPMEYIGYVSQVAAAYRTQSGGAYAAAAAAAPSPGLTAAGSPGSSDRTTAINEAYASLAASRNAAPVQAPASATPQATPTTNPYANQAAYSPAPSAPAQSTPTPSPAPAQVAAEAAVQLPPGSPPLGFDGYCPVTMKKEWKWVKGDIRYGAIHEGRTYLFASQQAQQEFLADGAAETYAPVLAGADVVAAVDQRRQADGKRDFAVEYPTGSGRFYLFASQENLEKFWSAPGSYAQGAQRVAKLPTGASFIR